MACGASYRCVLGHGCRQRLITGNLGPYCDVVVIIAEIGWTVNHLRGEIKIPEAHIQLAGDERFADGRDLAGYAAS